ncbi:MULTISPECIES: peptidoglycan bridge formation glycyltransferase FemA/FemB family protein [unclassified Brevibacterium]|uniref:lipid II:glycine glycyltransferase FemX n=1 Tax=unclassified Brevibacterium TaxID=2614124 RepID=UPI0010F63629|nr:MULTISPECIES: peptidoglycan bridge formation glycyltransferase FemA/FemB family protein [unclassified Brevibacterium]MCM1011159.1 aminoacyltransferase [Brevibacterium sp. XM4083]
MNTVRTIATDEYWRFLDRTGDASYQQTPEWSLARSTDWEHEPVGWFAGGDEPVAAAVIRYRRMPGSRLRFAYIPQGPLIDWSSPDVDDQLTALTTHLRARRVFGVRITPPLTLRRWDSATVRAGLADAAVRRFSDLPPDAVDEAALQLTELLARRGWRQIVGDPDTEASQPRLNFHLRFDDGTEETALKKMSKTWRKNIRKAARAEVEVRPGGRDDLGEVHRLFVETAERNGFDPQPREYLEAIWETMGETFPGDFALHVARHDGDAVAANATARIGDRVQGVLAATSAVRPEARPSNAVYWAIIRRAVADGAKLLDLGGVEDTLDAGDHASGLIRFKAEMGADAHEYIGAWDLPLQPAVYRAFATVLPLRARLRALRPATARALRSPAKTLRRQTERRASPLASR